MARKRCRLPLLADHNVFDTFEAGTTLRSQKNEEDAVTHALYLLSPQQRTLIILRYFEELKLEDIAIATNQNFSTGKSLKLADLFPDNYLETINTEIRRQIHDRLQNDKNAMFFKEDAGGFKTITPDQNFYINSDGKVVIVFEKYEIAPGCMGRLDFALPLPVTFPEHTANSESQIN